MSGPHILYRCFDADGGLLYIGITGDPGNRFAVHRCTTPWWHEVEKVTEEEFASRADLEEAERQAIRAEYPFYNQKDNPCWGCPTCHSPSPHFRPTEAIYGAVTVNLDGQEPFVICTDPFHCLDPADKAKAEGVHANRERLFEMGVIQKGYVPRRPEWEALGRLFTAGTSEPRQAS